MSNVPYYLQQARSGYRMGNGQMIDGMIHDGLWDPHNNYHMSNAGELCAKEYKFSREAQDDFAEESFRRALAAQKEGLFAAEIQAVSVLSEEGRRGPRQGRRGPAQRPPRQVPQPQARLPEGRDDHRRQRLVHQRRRQRPHPRQRGGREGHKLEPLARIVGYGSAA